MQYDTIHILTQLKSVSEFDMLNNLLQEEPFTNFSINTRKNGEIRNITAKIDNMRIYANDYYLRIQGSLSKYWHGNSIEKFTLSDTKLALEKLQDELKYPIIENGRLQRIDFCHDLNMEYKPTSYFRFLLAYPKTERFEQPNTLYFQNKSRVLTFYDKCKELKDKKSDIPDNSNTKNLLRFEFRMKKDLIRKEKIRPSRLYDEDFYRRMETGLLKEYGKIKKSNCSESDPRDLSNYLEKEMTAKEFEQQYLENCFSSNKASVLQLLKELQDNGRIKKQHYHNLKNKIIQAGTDNEKSSLIQELDRKIKEAAEYNREISN